MTSARDCRRKYFPRSTTEKEIERRTSIRVLLCGGSAHLRSPIAPNRISVRPCCNECIGESVLIKEAVTSQLAVISRSRSPVLRPGRDFSRILLCERGSRLNPQPSNTSQMNPERSGLVMKVAQSIRYAPHGDRASHSYVGNGHLDFPLCAGLSVGGRRRRPDIPTLRDGCRALKSGQEKGENWVGHLERVNRNM
jgi:hypothetical protein